MRTPIGDYSLSKKGWVLVCLVIDLMGCYSGSCLRQPPVALGQLHLIIKGRWLLYTVTVIDRFHSITDIALSVSVCAVNIQ